MNNTMIIRKTIVFPVFWLCIAHLPAQNTETIKVSAKEAPGFIAKEKYEFAGFSLSKVYFKNGDVAVGKLNYDYFNASMKYIDGKEDTLAIANEKDIKFISTGSDTFFYENRYFRLVSSVGTARLAIRKTLKLANTEKVGALGISSPNNNVESRSDVSDVTKHQLDINEVLVFVKQTTYYLSSANGRFVEATEKNFDKLFPGKNIKAYIDQHKLNLVRKQDIMNVFAYAGK